jgi:hypothetical protein
VLIGAFSFDPAAFERGGIMGLQMPTDLDVSARFRGRTFPGDSPVTLDVTLRSVCYANWCGALGTGPVLVLAETTPTGLRVSLDPCGSAAFPDPADADLSRLRACLETQVCEGAPLDK